MRKTLILLAILIIPSVAFLLIKSGKNQYTTPEIFGPREPVTLTENGRTVTDTVYHTVKGFSLLNEDSNLVTEQITDNKIFVADFFFTTCGTICPKMSGQLERVQREFKDDPSVSIVSFTVDPENDTPFVLKEYAKEYSAISGKWHFLTGDRDQIYDLARHSYFITAMEGDGKPDAFVHSEQLVLVDKEKRIRGFYDGTDPFDVKKLIEDIKVLTMHYEGKI
jgi:protein SCO1/2